MYKISPYTLKHDKSRSDAEIIALIDALFLKLDCSNDPLTGLLNIQNSVQIQGNYYLSFRNLDGTTNYMYMMATSAAGGGGYISAVNIPFELRYGVLGSVTQLSMGTDGSIIWNYGAGNCDFTINKLTAGQAYVYDAGLDTHTFSGEATFENEAIFEGGGSDNAVTITAGKRLVFDGA